MSSNELLLAKGRIAELKERYKELELKAESLLIQVREILNPFAKFLDIDLERAIILTKEFRRLQLDARECLDQTQRIKENYNL